MSIREGEERKIGLMITGKNEDGEIMWEENPQKQTSREAKGTKESNLGGVGRQHEGFLKWHQTILDIKSHPCRKFTRFLSVPAAWKKKAVFVQPCQLISCTWREEQLQRGKDSEEVMHWDDRRRRRGWWSAFDDPPPPLWRFLTFVENFDGNQSRNTAWTDTREAQQEQDSGKGHLGSKWEKLIKLLF